MRAIPSIFLFVLSFLFSGCNQSAENPKNIEEIKPKEPVEKVEDIVSLENFPKELIGEWATNADWYKEYGAEFSIEKTKFGYEVYYSRGRGNVIDINKSENTYLLHCYTDGSGELEIIEFKLIVNNQRLTLFDSFGAEVKLVKF